MCHYRSTLAGRLRAAGMLFLLLGVLLLAPAVSAQDDEGIDITDYDTNMLAMLQSIADGTATGEVDTTVFDAVVAAGDPNYIAPLLDIAYFSRSPGLGEVNDVIFNTLAELTGQDFGPDWRAYFEWAGANDVPNPPGYAQFKSFLFSVLVDPRFEQFFPEGVQETSQINLVEVVWGGVGVDGIPSLVNAAQITPEAAAAQGQSFSQFCRGDDCSYPAQDEFVFGVALDGDARAYPLRQLNWHEMFNDVIGSQPLYDAPGGTVVCAFRAPVDFRAVARQGDAWVQVTGDSAGCPDSGWLAEPASLTWADGDWSGIREALPESGVDPLDAAAAPQGQVPGRPVMLAYCTLCGAGVLYNPVIEIDGEPVQLEFGSTGLLMRSNKLMYDRNTNTVWNALTGEPAFGPLAGQGIQLERLPVVVTDWASWVAENPDTSVLTLDTGFVRNYTNGAAYSDYFNDPSFIMFPVWQADFEQSDPKDMVFALLLDDQPKAYFVETLVQEMVTNDTHAGQPLVIVSRESPSRAFFEPGGAIVRAYERGERLFSPGQTPRELLDETGVVWQVTGDGLVSPDGEVLARLPGHLAFWFGWFGFYPQTAVYPETE